jgi:subtilisin family serine protease
MNRDLRRGWTLALLLLAGCGAGGAADDGDGNALLAGGGGSAATPGTRRDRVLVKPKSLLSLPLLLLQHGLTVLEPVTGTEWLVVKVPAGTSASALVARLASDTRLLSVEFDVGLEDPEGAGSTIPAGGLMLASEIGNQPELQRIGAPAARARVTGNGVRVAVLDSGVLPALEGVAGHVDPDGYDFVDDDGDPTEHTNGLDDDGDGRVDEAHGHGSFVASLVVAVAPGARIVPVRVLDADGIGTSSGVAAAIGYAAQRGVKIVNLSVRVPPEVQVVRDAIENARLLGVSVIAAAGNTGGPDAMPAAAAESAFVVAAVDPGDVRAPFSSYGGAVDLMAPGVELHGAYPRSPGTARWSGTSFSAALVSGAYALVREQHPLWTTEDAGARLREQAAPVAAQNPGLDGMLGAGRLDLDATTAP